jgi:hypothetical protein
MNRFAWIGIIIWGIFITCFGLSSAAPGVDVSVEAHAQDVIFLIAGGLVSCLIGCVGLIGMMGWVPGLNLQHEQKTFG